MLNLYELRFCMLRYDSLYCGMSELEPSDGILWHCSMMLFDVYDIMMKQFVVACVLFQIKTTQMSSITFLTAIYLSVVTSIFQVNLG